MENQLSQGIWFVRSRYLMIVFFNSMILFSTGNLVIAQTHVPLTIDYALSTTYPDANMKRGYVLRDALMKSNSSILNDLVGYHNLGCELVCLPRDLNQFDPGYTGSYYYESYRSKGTEFFGGEPNPEEFRLVNGELTVFVNPNFLDICNEAKNQGLRMIIQATGTPVEGKGDGSVTQLFNLDPTRQFQQQARFYAIPAPGSYDSTATAVYKWMKSIKDGTGATNIIWAGHQEPSHTAGYPNGIQTDVGTENNIDDYTLAFKPLAQKIKDGGIGFVAGIQLNQTYQGYSRAAIAIQNNGVPIDFFSIQNYKGENNQAIVNEAVSQLSLHSSTIGKKLVFNRYDFDAGFSTVEERYNSAAGMTQFLKNELVIVNNANKILGYCLFTGAYGQPMMNSVMKFLNSQPVRRRSIAGIGSGINAWCTANADDFYMVLWNSATGDRSITIDLKSFPNAYNTHQMNIRKASGDSLVNYSNATWTPGTAGKIDDIILKRNEFVLIQLNAAGGAALKASKTKNLKTSDTFLVYPNPVKDQLHFRIPQDAVFGDFQMMNMKGQRIMNIGKRNLKIGDNELNVSVLSNGIYILRAMVNGKVVSKQILISR